jgi:hypothetical protein
MMAIKFDQVDMELEVLPAPPQRSGTASSVDEIWRVLRSSAFRETLRPIVVDIIGSELERARKRFG